jgi:ubiquinone/menaquinone biosynthesis C-methylase UbiE
LSATQRLAPAALAFDRMAEGFDARFTPWLSVAAQRRAVRRVLLEAFPSGTRLIDIGGGTGLDAAWLTERGRHVHLTDPAPQMVREAAAKLGEASVSIAGAEDLSEIADRFAPFDGAYSNFAALNCVKNLDSFASGLAKILRPGAPALLVLFGTFCPAEMIVEAAKGRWRQVFRRLSRTDSPARLAGQNFSVRYHRVGHLRAAMSPWFTYQGREAIGLFVPPSAAEPWISRHRRILRAMEALDRPLARPLALFGDHVLYRFVRTGEPAS